MLASPARAAPGRILPGGRRRGKRRLRSPSHAEKRGEFAAYFLEHRSRHPAGENDRPGAQVDAADMTGQNLAGNRQSRWQAGAAIPPATAQLVRAKLGAVITI
jgi:hypothetical protein